MFEAKTNLKTAIFFADGCEEIEGLTVVDLLYRAGIPCTKVSITQSTEVTSSHEVTFRTDTTITGQSILRKRQAGRRDLRRPQYPCGTRAAQRSPRHLQSLQR